jgi:hypothetical protein
MILIVLFLLFAALCSLIAATWNASQHLIIVKSIYLLLLAATIQIPVVFYGKFLNGPLLSTVLVTLWIFRNAHLPGSRWVLIGVISNGVAMAIHGGAMPLDPAVADQLGLQATPYLLQGSKDVIGQADLWQWLADWIVVRTSLFILVLSPGDLGILAGLLHWSCACRTQRESRQIIDQPVLAA